jgi:hypothetical protein
LYRKEVDVVVERGIAEGSTTTSNSKSTEKMLLQLLLQPLPTHQLQQPNKQQTYWVKTIKNKK